VSHAITAAVAALTATAALLLAQPEDVMSQDRFPCQEDEVLAYAPQFGPDRVGCLNIEEIK
jgi:hypothetical protein